MEQWKSVGLTGMTNGPWTAGKYKMGKEWIYRLYKGEKLVGSFVSFELLKAFVREHDKP